MDDSRIPTTEETAPIEFKTAFKGYNIAEVNEYVANQRAELEEIRAENAELYKKVDKLTLQLKKLKAAEDERNKKLDSTKAEADRIIKDAKKKAAQELLRANRQCSLMVADMTEKVDEQKRLYQATKIEAAKFRRELFILYRDHVELINAMSEASGAFDEDSAAGLTEIELADMEELLETLDTEPEYEEVDQSAFDSADGQTLLIEAFSDTASITIPPAAKGKKSKEKKKKNVKAEEKKKAEGKIPVVEPQIDTSSQHTEDDMLNSDDGLDDGLYEDMNFREGDASSQKGSGWGPADVFEEDIPAEGDEYDEEDPIDGENYPEDEYPGDDGYSEDSYSEDEYFEEDENGYFESEGESAQSDDFYSVADDVYPEDVAFVMTEEDLEEFTNPDGAEMEYDGPVSVDSVFKKNPAKEAGFEKLYGDSDWEKAELSDPVKESEAHPENKKTRKKNGYGFKVTEKKKDPDDDSNEFYMESDAEFDPAATEGVPTGTVGSFGVTSRAPSSERRWKVKKSKSLTDEFDVIKAESDEE